MIPITVGSQVVAERVGSRDRIEGRVLKVDPDGTLTLYTDDGQTYDCKDPNIVEIAIL